MIVPGGGMCMMTVAQMRKRTGVSVQPIAGLAYLGGFKQTDLIVMV